MFWGWRVTGIPAPGPDEQDGRHHHEHDHQEYGQRQPVCRGADDDVHAGHRGQGGDRQGDGDHGQPFGGDGHLGAGTGPVELDHALQVVLLPVGYGGDALELTGDVGELGLPAPGAGDLEGRLPAADLPAERAHVTHG